MTDRPPALSAAEGPPEECANCGADERTGWRETSVYDGLNLPDSAYDDGPRPPRRQGLAWYWIVAIVAGIIVSLFFSLGGR
jgi:hypothetical protein